MLRQEKLVFPILHINRIEDLPLATPIFYIHLEEYNKQLILLPKKTKIQMNEKPFFPLSFVLFKTTYLFIHLLLSMYQIHYYR